MYTMGVAEGEERGKGAAKMFEEIMTEKCLKSDEKTLIYGQETQ